MSDIEEHLMQYGIAVIGLAGRFPGADTIEAFWRNLQNEVESITTFSDETLTASGVSASLKEHPNYVPAKGILDDISGFDAPFFNISAREAALIDPQQRIFLECAWEALESAGYAQDNLKERVGVFASASKNTYLLFNLATHPELYSDAQAMQSLIANEKDYVSMRTAYKLNLKGPSVTVQTACSSSLVSIHLACQSLLSGESDMVLAGGTAIDVPHKAGYLYQPGGIFSPDGHCRVFDSSARGTVFGQGVGVVTLKLLSRALEDGDHIHAVIRGSAINNDGHDKAGFTAPSVKGQINVITDALDIADVDAATIDFVEAHGTGTNLGDPIEVEALEKAFKRQARSSLKQKSCAIGSVKSNIGHLNAASGVVGFIKAVLSLEHGHIPKSLHCERPNTHIDFENSPFYVSQGASFARSTAETRPRRAGVSAFGIGGTNAHVILEEAPLIERAENTAEAKEHLILLSARTLSALNAMRQRLSDYIATHKPRLEDVAYTLQVGRARFAHRMFLVCRTHQDLIDALAKGGQQAVMRVDATLEKAIDPALLTDLSDEDALNTLGEQWLLGGEFKWHELHHKAAKRIALPTYPFEHQSYWIAPKARTSAAHQPEVTAVETENVLQIVKGFFKQLLGVSDAQSDDQFFELGGDSLLGVELIGLIKRTFKLDITFNQLFTSPTVEGIATLIESILNQDTTQVLLKHAHQVALDIRLDDSLMPPTKRIMMQDAKAVLLTGATGFLGSFILNELLEQTDKVIYCLVRADSIEKAFERIKLQFNQYGLKGLKHQSRVRCVPGDLSKPNFGLIEQAYVDLAQTVDAIYHCGARLSFVDPYDNLKKINLEGTRSVIQFACAQKTKHIHHVSSIAVYDSDTYKGLSEADETLSLENSQGFHSGYDETKWASEMLIAEARMRGVPVTVYRPGNISGDSRTGVCSATDLVGMMIKGCIALGVAPDDDAIVDVVPIDYVSRALVCLSLNEASHGEIYNLVNTTPVSWIELVHTIQSLNYPLETIAFDDWHERLNAAKVRGDDNPLISLLPMFGERTLFSNRLYSGKKAMTYLKDTPIRCHPMDATLISLYLEHLYQKETVL
ncbi:MAG: thioester reductase domain-containing protein [Gammaproteobacteria bacterium]|nr:thioester reductase domain-containing protein [Gammaproteobacteria bacterium]